MSQPQSLLTATAMATVLAASAIAPAFAQQVILQTTSEVPATTTHETTVTTTHTMPDGTYATSTQKQVEVSTQPVTQYAQTSFPGSVAGIAATQADYSTLANLLKTTSLDTSLAGDTAYTAFLPTNSAFTDLLPAYQKILAKPASNRKAIANILNYHIVPQRYTYAQLQQMVTGAMFHKVKLVTLSGDPLYITQDSQGLIVTDVRNMSTRIAPEPGLPEAYPSSVFRIGALFVPL